jgi:hypothetical protein
MYGGRAAGGMLSSASKTWSNVTAKFGSWNTIRIPGNRSAR